MTLDLLLSARDWWIAPDAPGLESSIFDDGFDPAQSWVPATVPGNIQSDLEAVGRIDPITNGVFDQRLQDTAETDWWYCKDFTLPADYDATRTSLVFYGVDFSCDVWLNGTRLLSHAGQYRRFTVDVGKALVAGRNRLAVRIDRMPEELVPFLLGSDTAMSGWGDEHWFVYANNKIRRVLKDLKSPATTGYDWACNIWTLGIWKDVHLKGTGSARIDWLHATSQLSEDLRTATVRVRTELDSSAAGDVEVQVRLEGHGTAVSAVTVATVSAGAAVVDTELTVDDPQLWWPFTHGAQPLYDVVVSVVAPGSGEVLDTSRTRFAIREITWGQVEGMPDDFISPSMLILNRQPIRMLGSNMLTPDILAGRSADSGVWAMQMARHCGINTIRINGGGTIWPSAVYDAADELGVMLSLEFPIANCLPERDEEFLGNLEVTLRSIVKEVRNHACIVEYTGGNEMSWKDGDDHPALHLMLRVCAEEDDRLFRATDPVQGGRHSPWHYDPQTTYTHYDDPAMTDTMGQHPMMRYGEFGTQSPANIEVWRRDLPEESQWPIGGYDDPALIRKNAVEAVFSDEFWIVAPILESLFGISPSLEHMIKAGQLAGAEGLRYSVDALRRRGKTLGGLMTWNFAEPWSNAAGSFCLDYDGNTVMSYDFLKQALAPISINLKQLSPFYDPAQGLDVQVWVVSDIPGGPQQVTWSWVARDRRGQVFGQSSGEASVDTMGAVQVDTVQVVPPAATAFGPVFLELQLRDAAGELLTERVHFFGLRDVRGPLSGMLKGDRAEVDDATAGAPGTLTPRGTVPSNPDNFAYVGNGAAPARAEGWWESDTDVVSALNDGKWGWGANWTDPGAWTATTPGAQFTIDLGQSRQIGHFRLGRDRSGSALDRMLDVLTIEVSADGEAWQQVFQQDKLAAHAGYRRPPYNDEYSPLGAYDKYRPVWTLDVWVDAVDARHVRVTVDAEEGASRLPAIDEFEVYAPSTARRGALPQFEFTDMKELDRSVAPTQLTLVSTSVEQAAGREVLSLVLQNTGDMTALFCQPHPVLNYRTDVYIGNKNVCIPPGETRTITIDGPLEPEHGLSLEQTGWRVACWNAEELQVAPATSVLVSFGRQDGTTYGFSREVGRDGVLSATGGRVDAADVAHVVSAKSPLHITFDVTEDRLGEAVLRLHSADRSQERAPVVEITLNDAPYELTLPTGVGRQDTEPGRPGLPATTTLALPAGAVRAGANVLAVTVSNDGWFTWDALDLTLRS